ncbi:GNAT family N-acetyltransferase [Streptomyces sp. NA02950]|uniref:GNAT family N-acetyltransferase n=1 Tax=Streptomyces sp. NA02950 TaxID=2742137 RepID=UPI0015904872|nr:GNAT family N-acetyltransferase [Streptomyces sp. NA02950]QKV94628.1 GNAT family N-acetyltransferase [Streptomyces sp. NA02950]
MEPVTLITERLVLRPFRASDADAVFAACQDPDIQRWTPVPSPYERGHAEDFTGRTSPDNWRGDIAYDFAVLTKGDGTLVGAMGLVRLERLHGPAHQAELGYWTVREQRRRGYTGEAARAVAEWAFTALGVERLEWCAEAGNEGSRAVALAAGFRMEGTDRARIVHRGTRRDAWRGALLPSDRGLPSATPYLPHLPARPSDEPSAV